MAKQNKKRDTGCPVCFALDAFGDRWALVIIRDIVLRGFKTYGQFLEAGDGIATNVLADRLRELEAEGIVWKTRDPENHRKLNYSLTEKGCDLVPLLFEVILWSAKYDAKTKANKSVLKRMETDREAYLKEIRARFLSRVK